MKTLVVWYDPNKNLYYYKLVYDFSKKYHVGFKNQYNHEVILTIDVYKELIYKCPFIKKVLRKIISFLHKIYNKL